MLTTPTYDAVIVGAGPAGSVLALRCAQLGLRVLIVEREAFPRPRIGESISAGCLRQLESLGMGEALTALRFPAAQDIRVRWGEDWQTRSDPHPGLLVDRGDFDALLLRMAQAHGAELWQPARLLGRQALEQGWRLTLRRGATEHHVQCRWLVDASGRQRALRLPLRRQGPSTWALHAEWPKLAASPRLVAVEHGWLWRVPLPAGRTRIFVFSDAAELRRSRTSTPMASLYRQAVASSGILDASERAADHDRVLAVDASAALLDWPLPAAVLAVGDAAVQIDPLAASGVQLAIQTGLWAALVINTALRFPADREVALRFYQQALADSAARHQRFAGQHYAAAGLASEFWRARCGTLTVDSERPDQTIVPSLPRLVQLGLATHWEQAPCALAQRIILHPTLVCRHSGQRAAFVAGKPLRDLFPDASTRVASRQLPSEALASLLQSGLLRAG